MAKKEPVAGPMLSADNDGVTSWAAASKRLQKSETTYWLSIVCPDGWPHTMAVLGPCLDGAL